MRKFASLCIISLILSKNVCAQANEVYKPFKIDMGIGTTFQSFELSGFLLYMEPGYTFKGLFKTGMRFEEAVLSMKNIGSVALTFDYYFVRHSGLRLFAGGGFSHYNTSASGGCDPGPNATQITRNSKSSGGLVRIGMEFNHLRFGMEYNMVPSTYVTASGPGDQNGSTVVYKNNYFALKIAMAIGGGKKMPGMKTL
jgi:hypothetical protein